jgi:hypothetical protein
MVASKKLAWDKIPVAVYSDPVFFHKSNVKVGTTFRNVGRLSPNTTWVVQAIWTMTRTSLGITRHYVADVRTLQDRIELRCEENGETKNLAFGGMSYSAIWRVEEPPPKLPDPTKPGTESKTTPNRPRLVPKYKPKPTTSGLIKAAKEHRRVTKEEREERRARREANPIVDDTPLADWAKNLLGDERLSQVTLQHILDGIDIYFGMFDQLRRVDPFAYHYFSRVGTPIILNGARFYKSHFDILKLPDPSKLPSFVGAFFPRSTEEYRKDIIEDRPALMEFNYFNKAKNLATVTSPGTTVYMHHLIALKHEGAFSKQEMKKFPVARGDFGVWFPIGITINGEIKALPWHMQHDQQLPCGEFVHHSSFEIPKGVVELGGHEFARLMFLATMIHTATAISGLQVTITKGKTTARFGIPIQNAKEFFADREPDLTETGRRRSIMHLRFPHHRYLKDGRIIRVGEHLRGERSFLWHGYNISVGAPGIHYPSPEGLASDVFIDHKADPHILPVDIKEKIVPVMNRELTKHYQSLALGSGKVPFRRGEPTTTYTDNVLPKLDKK